MNRIRHLIREIHRRSLWQVLGIYLVGSWVGYQVVLGLTDGVGLPDWVPGFAVVLFIIGLPVVLATAFIQEGLPGGVAATSEPEAASSGMTAPIAQPAPASSRLTWRRSMMAGVVAFALFGFVVGGHMALRAAGVGPFGSLVAAGKLEDQARILIADFGSTVGDTALAALVTEAFRIDFARSTAARAVEAREVRDVLRRMGRDDTPRLDPALAREIAVREGIDAYIIGEVAQAAAGYVLSARLIATAEDEVLAALRETAREDDDLIQAIDRLSRSLRERTGESLRSIRRTEPLARVTTPSLPALEKYTQALRASAWLGDPGRARQLLEEAVALDSTFAAAHFGLAVFHSNSYRAEAALAALEKTLRWQDRLTESQRHGARAMQHNIRKEYAAAAAAYERAIEADPQSFGALNNLALAHARAGDYQRAAHYFRRAIALDTLRFFGYMNLGEVLVKAGNTRAARDTFAVAARLAPASAWAAVSHATAGYPEGEYVETEENLRAMIADESASSAMRTRATRLLTELLAARGRFSESQRLRESGLLGDATPAAAQQDLLEARLYYELWTLEEPERARGTLQRLEKLLDGRAEPDSSAAFGLAEVCAWLGDAQCARAHLARGRFNGHIQPWTDGEVHYTLGAIALAEQDVDGAVAHFRDAQDGNCLNCEEAFVGRAFDRAGRPDSALAAYQRYLASQSMDRIYADALVLGRILERAGELHAQRGDAAQAARAWAHLLRLWEDADAELQPVVSDVRRRLAALQPDR